MTTVLLILAIIVADLAFAIVVGRFLHTNGRAEALVAQMHVKVDR